MMIKLLILGIVILVALIGIDTITTSILSQNQMITVIEKSDSVYKVKIMSGEWLITNSDIYKKLYVGGTFYVKIENYNMFDKRIVQVIR